MMAIMINPGTESNVLHVTLLPSRVTFYSNDTFFISSFFFFSLITVTVMQLHFLNDGSKESVLLLLLCTRRVHVCGMGAAASLKKVSSIW